MKLKFVIYILIILIGLLFLHYKQTKNYYKPQIGDLLFQDLDCGELCVAIETVTKGIDGAKFSHVAIVSRIEKEQAYILEAIGDQVKETELNRFLLRSKDKNQRAKVFVGRLKQEFIRDIFLAIQWGRKQIGKNYDDIFILGDNKYYCSELVYEMFKRINVNLGVYPMTFKDPKTNKFFPAWISYYKKLKHRVPEGDLGLNPGSISQEKVIDIIYKYGCPESYTGACS